MKNKKYIIATVVVIILTVVGISACRAFKARKEPSVEVQYFKSVLAKSSELTAAKWKFTAMSEYSDSGIPFLTKGDFVIVFEATARAGINLDEVEIDINNLTKNVSVKIPKATIQDVKVDNSSIQYFKSSFAPLNADIRVDSNKAVALAEEDAKREAEESGILELANQQAETLVKGILADAIPSDYQLDVKQSLF